MFDLPPPDPSLEIVAATRGYSKGLAQTDGPQLVGRATLDFGLVSLAAQLKNVDSNAATSEYQLRLGFERDVTGFAVEAGIAYKGLTGVEAPTDTDSVEFTASAQRAFGRFSPQVAVTFSFDDLGDTRESLYAEAGGSVRLGAGTRLAAMVGRRERGGGDDYTAFHAALSQRLGAHVTAELSYYDSAQSARGDAYEARLVGALRLRF